MGIALTQAQDIVLGVVELHEVHTGLHFKPVKINYLLDKEELGCVLNERLMLSEHLQHLRSRKLIK